MRKRALVCTVALAGLIAFAASKKPLNLPPPNATPSVANAPKMIPRPAGAMLKVPAGFSASEFATGFKKPRYMLQLANGTVLVSDSVAKGSIWAIQADGSKKELIANLDRPFGMALWKDFLYVTEAESIKRYKLDVAALSAGAGEEIIPLKDYGKGHWTRSIAFDKTGSKMYLSLGSGSNIDTGDPKDRNAINVYNPDGSGHEIFATGLRNPVSIRWNPVSGKLWSTVQERDGLGDDLVPDYFTEVKKGAFYGWPFAYIGAHEEPRHKGEAPELVKKSIEPDVILQAHASVMDFIFYTGQQFPKRYVNGAFLAYRGSSNRSKRVGYSVVFIPFKNGKPAGDVEDFVTGWMLAEDQKEVWGRPVGLLQMTDGSLLVSEDGNNTIWRVSYGK
ncbi:MAG TPA: PQQ-dependent sugar dehydrogenase [Bryobacteraceae bacterium]|jgi:glucose/arabinose dehydrogenase|nr:PQQ-dependent sugar dehydrogenase [Bryobacteraceae bacterium]